MTHQISKLGLTSFLAQLVSILRAKSWKGSHKGKNMFFNFWVLLPKMYIFEVVTFFFCLVVVQSTQFFSGSTYLSDPRFWWSTFPLTIRMAMVTDLFRMVTCFQVLSPINMHDISSGWCCGVTWQMKYILNLQKMCRYYTRQGAALV